MRISSQTWGFNAKSLLAGTIAGLAVIAFAVTGFGGSLGKKFDSNIAAHVGSQSVSMRTLNEIVQDYERQQGSNGDAERRNANIQTALNQLVREKVLLEEATRIGWLASDLEVASWIHSVPAFQDEKTKQFRQDLYQRFLKSGRMTTLELFQNGRENIGRSKMNALLALSLRTPTQLLKEKTLLERTEFEVEYVEIKPSQQSIDNAITEAAQKLAAAPESLKSLQESYENAKQEFQHKAQVHFASILISWKDAQRPQGDALNRTKDQAKALATATLARIRTGEQFELVASEINDDPITKSKSGDMGWMDESQIDPATFQNAQKLSKATPLSEVVETPFGYRILQWKNARSEQNKSFEDVKLDLARRRVEGEIRAVKASETRGEFEKALATKDQKLIEDLLAKNSLSWMKLKKPVSAKERFVEGLGMSESLIPALFELKNNGEITSSIVNITGRNFAFRMLSRKDPVPPTEQELTNAADMEKAFFARNFQQEAERKLYEVYTRDQDIRINPALNALE